MSTNQAAALANVQGRPAGAARPDEVPLCVDLDGTIVAADMLHECLFTLVRTRPWSCVSLPFHVLRGRAAFKQYVAALAAINPEKLPYRHDVLEYLRRQKEVERTLLLVTAADRRIAHLLAAHLGLFDAVIASDGVNNVKGVGKVRAIEAHLGGKPFDYIGDSFADLPVFASARRALLVHPSPALYEKACRVCTVEHVFRPD